jgi:hypothetical protein
MKRFYVTPEEADEYVALRLLIKSVETARDRYMSATMFDIEFLRQCGIEWYPTEQPPALPKEQQQ